MQSSAARSDRPANRHPARNHRPATPPLPGEPAPPLRLRQVGSDRDWDLSQARPENFTLLVVYRGLHCPKCKEQLETLNGRMEDFTERGIEVVALSCDDRERAGKSRDEWDIDDVPLYYGLTIEQARAWGLFISDAIKDEEPARFSEPGLFLVDADGTVQIAWIQSSPFARPQFDDILSATDFILKKSYPPRGTVPVAA